MQDRNLAPSFPMVDSIGIPTAATVGASGFRFIGIPIAMRIGARTDMFATYILQSEKDGSFYIGSTENLEARVAKHNKGYSRYTKTKLPWKLVYKEVYNTLSDAKKREYYLKSLKSKVVLEKLIKFGPIV